MLVLLKGFFKLFRLPLITIAVVAAIIMITIMTRAYIGLNDRKSIPALSQQVMYFDAVGYNKAEKEALALLAYEYQNNIIDQGKNSTEYRAYFKYLKDQLVKDGVDLDDTQGKKMEELAKSLGNVIYHEGGIDIKDMTIDGKAAALYLAKQIYEICGLEIEFDLEGKIQLIKDPAGTELYRVASSSHEVRIQVNALILTMACIVILLAICVMISKKNHLFKEKSTYEATEEKIYA